MTDALAQNRETAATQDKSSALSVQSVGKRFGGIAAVQNCSLMVKPRSITGLVGPNGAGKTTLLDLISGFQRVDQGEIFLNQHLISGLPANKVAMSGIARTFQIPRPIPTMTVLENLVLAAPGQRGERLWNTWLRPGRVGAQENEIIDHALWVLEYVDLIHLRDQYASVLSGGQKKLLEFARTLMSDAKVVLLDEPAAGVNRSLMRRLSERIREQQEAAGITYLIVEHDMEIVASLCDYVIVMSQGEPIFTGCFEDMVKDDLVLGAYLGSQYR